MSTKPNYFKLGLFILTALFLLIVGIILFGSGVFAKEKVYFETYFKNSVAGLSAGAPVLDQGVQIGTVEDVGFVRNDYTLPKVAGGFSPFRPYVRVVCSIHSENLPEMTQAERLEILAVLIKNGLRLQLSTNILTGQGMLEASYLDSERFPLEDYPWEPIYPVIPSAPSTFTTLKDSVDKILAKLEQVETQKIAENLNELIVSIDQAVADADVKNVSQRAEALLDSANQAIEDARIGELGAEAVALFAEARQTNKELKMLLESRGPGDEDGLANIAQLVDQMNTTLFRLDQLVRMRSPQVSVILQNFKQITDDFKDLTENLKKNPSELIFSEPPEKKETVQ